MTLSITELRKGKKITLNNEPYVVMNYEHSKMGRQGGVVRTSLRNLVTGAVLQKTFQGNETAEEAHVEASKAQYLYKDAEGAHCMNIETYDQFAVPLKNVENEIEFMKEGEEVTVLHYQDQPIAVQLPPKVVLEIIETPPGVKGDTASGGTKLATLETGATVQVPLFLNVGDKIRVNTETGEYVERA